MHNGPDHCDANIRNGILNLLYIDLMHDDIYDKSCMNLGFLVPQHINYVKRITTFPIKESKAKIGCDEVGI